MTENKMSMTKFHSVLQLEYIQHAWAKLVFPKRYQKKYGMILKEKQRKILDISTRINAENIFTNESLLLMYAKNLFPESGIPNFLYRNEKVKDSVHLHNVRNFFLSGEFKYINVTTGEEETLKCTEVFVDNKCVLVNGRMISMRHLKNNAANNFVKAFKYL